MSLKHAPILIKQLDGSARSLLLRHMLRLSVDDIRMRFGGRQTEASVTAYVDRIDFNRDTLYGVFDYDLALTGVTHVGMGEEAEFGVSVLPAFRGRGIGTALFERAEEHATNNMISTFFVHTLTENKPMLAIARKRKMRIITEAGEADCFLNLPRPDVGTITSEFLQDRVALFDFALKAQVMAARTISNALVPRPKLAS